MAEWAKACSDAFGSQSDACLSSGRKRCLMLLSVQCTHALWLWGLICGTCFLNTLYIQMAKKELRRISASFRPLLASLTVLHHNPGSKCIKLFYIKVRVEEAGNGDWIISLATSAAPSVTTPCLSQTLSEEKNFSSSLNDQSAKSPSSGDKWSFTSPVAAKFISWGTKRLRFASCIYIYIYLYFLVQ